MSDVLPIFGGPSKLTAPEDVIEAFEYLLDKAKRGEIIGVACVCIDPADVSTTTFVGDKTMLLGATLYLQRDLMNL